MSGTLSQVDLCNLALMRLGQLRIKSITDQSDGNAIACNVAWQQALATVSRETPWNCLKKRAYLTQVAAPADATCTTGVPPAPAAWAPGTNYAVNDFITYASQIYQCLIANTASNSFTIDLTKGWWFETTFISWNYLGPIPGNAGPMYEWAYAYELPTDFILLIELNGQNCWQGVQNTGNTFGSLYEIYQKRIYCNTQYADIKYNRFETDTTNFDSMFAEALVLNLASMIATTLRKDDAQLSIGMFQEYRAYIARALVKNGNERNAYRYNIVSQSRFVGSRYRSTNG